MRARFGFALVLLVSHGASAGEGCVFGQVLDLRGRPVAEAGIALVPRDGGAPRGHSRTDATGGFVAADVLPGAYWLVVERLGFEPEIRPLEVTTADGARADVRLAPLATLALRRTGKDDLTWLLRGVASDPLREEGGLQPAEARAPDTRKPAVRPVQGRVAWNTMGGALVNVDALGPAGNRTEVELGGNLATAARWFVDGRLDGLQYADANDSGDAGELTYGVGLGEAHRGVEFRGAVVRASRQFGPEASPGSLEERRASYAVDYRSRGPSDDLGVHVSYRAALASNGLPSQELPGVEQRHAIWEGRGRYGREITPRHRLETVLRVRAQQWTTPNTNLLADAVPQSGFVRDGSYLDPRSWELFLSGEHSWSLLGPVLLVSGVEVSRSSGELGGPFLRPRVGVVLSITKATRLRGETSFVVRDRVEPVRAADGGRGMRPLAARIALERAIGENGRFIVSASQNGWRDLDGDRDDDLATGVAIERRFGLRQDYLVFARGPVETRELDVQLRSSSLAGVSGFLIATFGSAQGELGLLPLGYVRPGGELRRLPSDRVRYASAAFGAALERTSTDLLLRYRWLDPDSGEDGGYVRVDLELDQELPWWELGGSRLDLVLAIRSYLNRGLLEPQSERLLAFDPSPVFSAGVGVRF